VLNLRLQNHAYLADDNSIADIANWNWVRTHNWFGVEINHLPNVQRWLKQIAARPAAQKGITVPYEIKTMDHGQGDEPKQRAVEIRKMVQR
jgi:GST-like protein